MIKHELDFVWITSDGKRFLDKAEATKHEETLHIEEEDIVTQWLMETSLIADFISKQTLPVHVGITGPLKITSLIKFANIVGAKNSINFIKSNFSKALDLLKPKDPNDLIGKVKSHTDFFHIYTFGGLKETNKWLMENKYV